MEELEKIVGNHGHSSKKQSSKGSEGSLSGSAGSGSASSIEEEGDVNVVDIKNIVEEPIQEKKEEKLLLNKKQKQSSEESSESSEESSSGSASASMSGSAIEDLHDAKKEIIKEKKLKPGQKLDGDPIPQSSDVPHTAIRGFLTNVVKDRKLKTVTAVIDINGTEFNFLANEKTEIQVGANRGNLNDLLPSETVVFTAKNHSILTHVRIIAGVAKGIVNKVDYIANTMIVEETNKKKRQPLI